MWTHFWDMHSGGGQKDAFAHCFIEAPESEACRVFYAMFGHTPGRVSCTCCGPDYSVSEHESLEDATGYLRGCEDSLDGEHSVETPRKLRGIPVWYMTLAEYESQPDVRIVHASEIHAEHRVTSVPEQGYVWRG